jgi:hypothetical protein
MMPGLRRDLRQRLDHVVHNRLDENLSSPSAMTRPEADICVT